MIEKGGRGREEQWERGRDGEKNSGREEKRKRETVGERTRDVEVNGSDK